jgi:polar amino acid transport system ATP-binding protein
MAEQPLLVVDDIRKTFGEAEVLKGVSFSVQRSQVIGLLGRSGSGKSTLLRCINMLETASSGRILLDGEEIGYEMSGGRRRRLSSSRLAAQRRSMSMVFQHFNLWPHRSVLENVTEGPIHVLGIDRREAEAEAMDYLDKVGLKDKATSYPVRLSGGQQQRVGIARALAMRPKIMLFDEPTSALDPELVQEVLKVMLDLAAAGITMVVVTHEMSFAREACDEVVLLADGEIIERGSPQAVMRESDDLRVRQFFSSQCDRP